MNRPTTGPRRPLPAIPSHHRPRTAKQHDAVRNLNGAQSTEHRQWMAVWPSPQCIACHKPSNVRSNTNAVAPPETERDHHTKRERECGSMQCCRWAHSANACGHRHRTDEKGKGWWHGDRHSEQSIGRKKRKDQQISTVKEYGEKTANHGLRQQHIPALRHQHIDTASKGQSARPCSRSRSRRGLSTMHSHSTSDAHNASQCRLQNQ